MSSILTNTSAMVALQTLRGVNQQLSTTQDQISTGMKIGSAKDNAAIWAISKVMESDVQGFRSIKESLSLGQSSVTVARAASETITNLLTDIKGKIVAAQEANVDRGKIQTDIAELRNQIGAVVNAAQFNGLNMVDNANQVSILSSLDRASDGTVTARSITVEGQGLGMNAAVAGTTESSELAAIATADGLDGGNVQTAASVDFALGGTAPAGTDQDVTFTIGGTAPNDAAGTETFFVVNGVQIDVTFGDEATDEQMAEAIENAFNAAAAGNEALEGITVDRTGAALEFTSSGVLSEVEIDFSEIQDNVAGVTAQTGAAESSATLDASAEETTVQITVNGVELNVTFADGADDEAMAAAIAAAVEASDAAALDGVTVSVDEGTVTFTNGTGGEISVDLGEVNDLAGATVTGTGVEDGAATIADNSARISFAGEDVALAGGDTFRVTLGSGEDAQVFEFTLANAPADTEAGRAAAFQQIAEGLAAAINDEGTDLTASVNEDGELVISNSGDDPLAYSFEAFTDGEAAGRLNPLADIDVSTQEGAESALAAIEGLIQTAIDASAAFGSAQGRISQQSEFVTQLTDALRAGIGTLVDADMEEASARLQALQVQQQLAIQSLSIANQQPQNILSLFR